MQTEASWLSNVDLCKALEHLESNAIVQRGMLRVMLFYESLTA